MELNRPENIEYVDRLKQAVATYAARHQHSFTVHDLHSLSSWKKTPEASKTGCYALYAENGDLLYVGKSSQSRAVGYRLWYQLRSAKWAPMATFVQIIEVSEAYEAPSLEEYLIRELQPRYNGVGIWPPKEQSGSAH